MKLIGKGMFTKAYLVDQTTIELHSSDPVKECLALYGFGESYLWPKLTRIEYEKYRMRYYPKTQSLRSELAPDQYRLYSLLRKIPPASFYTKTIDYAYCDYWRKKFSDLPVEYVEEKEALLDALDSLTNYGADIQFEIGPRNVGVDRGKLVLLDCFFFVNKLIEAKTSKRKNRGV